MQVVVIITRKEGVLDPEGKAITQALLSLGYREVSEVATSKQLTIEIDEDDEARAHQKVAKMCEVLLVNSVIEDYEIQTKASPDALPENDQEEDT